MMGRIHVEEGRHPGAIAALRPAWESLNAELRARGGTRGPFLRPEWCAVQAAFIAPRSLRLLTAWRSGELRGVLPLIAESRPLSRMPGRILRSLSDEHSQRFDALVADDGVASALMRHLLADRSWDVLELRDAPVEGPTGVGVLTEAAAEAGCLLERWPSLASPYLTLPESVADVDRWGSAKFRANRRRRKRKLEHEVGPVACERVPNDASSTVRRAAVERSLMLESAAWKGSLGTAIACDEALVRRYHALVDVFAARDELALYFLTVAGERRAFQLALVDGGVYYLLKTSYDPALASYGPGHLLVESVARDLVRRGVREMDFLGDDAPWKREWTDKVRPHAWYYAFRDTCRGRLLHAWKFRLTPRLKRVLSPAAANGGDTAQDSTGGMTARRSR